MCVGVWCVWIGAAVVAIVAFYALGCECEDATKECVLNVCGLKVDGSGGEDENLWVREGGREMRSVRNKGNKRSDENERKQPVGVKRGQGQAGTVRGRGQWGDGTNQTARPHSRTRKLSHRDARPQLEDAGDSKQGPLIAPGAHSPTSVVIVRPHERRYSCHCCRAPPLPVRRVIVVLPIGSTGVKCTPGPPSRNVRAVGALHSPTRTRDDLRWSRHGTGASCRQGTGERPAGRPAGGRSKADALDAAVVLCARARRSWV